MWQDAHWSRRAPPDIPLRSKLVPENILRLAVISDGLLAYQPHFLDICPCWHTLWPLDAVRRVARGLESDLDDIGRHCDAGAASCWPALGKGPKPRPLRIKDQQFRDKKRSLPASVCFQSAMPSCRSCFVSSPLRPFLPPRTPSDIRQGMNIKLLALLSLRQFYLPIAIIRPAALTTPAFLFS